SQPTSPVVLPRKEAGRNEVTARARAAESWGTRTPASPRPSRARPFCDPDEPDDLATKRALRRSTDPWPHAGQDPARRAALFTCARAMDSPARAPRFCRPPVRSLAVPSLALTARRRRAIHRVERIFPGWQSGSPATTRPCPVTRVGQWTTTGVLH